MTNDDTTAAELERYIRDQLTKPTGEAVKWENPGGYIEGRDAGEWVEGETVEVRR